MAFEVKMPQLGLTMEEGTVTKWVKQEGDTVKAGDVILEITTDKLTSEVESEHDGVLLKIVAQEGEDIPVKGLLAYIGEAGEQVGDAPAAKAEAPAAEAAAPVPAAAPAAPVAPVAGGRIRISPLAKKTAAKLGVDYTTVAGSGPLGRIVQKDILAAAEAAKAAPAPATQAAEEKAAPKKTALELMDGDEVVKLAGMRKVVSERMTKSAQEIPTVTQNVRIDVTELMAFRKKINNDLGVKYSLNDYVLKATAKAHGMRTFCVTVGISCADFVILSETTFLIPASFTTSSPSISSSAVFFGAAFSSAACVAGAGAASAASAAARISFCTILPRGRPAHRCGNLPQLLPLLFLCQRGSSDSASPVRVSPGTVRRFSRRRLPLLRVPCNCFRLLRRYMPADLFYGRCPRPPAQQNLSNTPMMLTFSSLSPLSVVISRMTSPAFTVSAFVYPFCDCASFIVSPLRASLLQKPWFALFISEPFSLPLRYLRDEEVFILLS